MAEKKLKRKTKKCKSSLVCCKKCANYNKGLCSLNGRDVEEDGVCKSFSEEMTKECQRCHRKVHYKNRDEYYNSIINFSMESGSGTSSSQNFHLCRKCETDIFGSFQDFLENINSIENTIQDDKKVKIPPCK